ncbi:hypothetical protein G7059_08040 [Erysipelothrix sp. HDW6A]|uniref:hypothetical protein n=1 Tax=Erysipelothrix sp. HDW6A TaxID=2714928 RepID=UPI00140B05B8|nr:hypothetical protein [Erysipelothrix sp. HDW6A]QIK57792.1 hypothetical protein G7059_08040 [Erysipelothrix sp. HDW6A]
MPENIHTTYEKVYGVANQFGDRHNVTMTVCPVCLLDDYYLVEDEIEYERD